MLAGAALHVVREFIGEAQHKLLCANFALQDG